MRLARDLFTSGAHSIFYPDNLGFLAIFLLLLASWSLVLKVNGFICDRIHHEVSISCRHDLSVGLFSCRLDYQGSSGWKLHAIHHLTASYDDDGHPHSWRAIHPDDYPLEFFEYHSELHEAPQRRSHR
jgi:hypothetical protein